jgi:hypothetical protein
MAKPQTKVMSPFEMSRKILDSTINSNDEESLKTLFGAIESKTDFFESLVQSGETLDKTANGLIAQIETLKKNNKNELEKNFTFTILFNSLNLLLEEYKSQTSLFSSYSKAYFELYNEENLVKVLDILREILKERKTILNDIINNIIKIQKLTNDRIKIDMGTDDETGDFLDQDEIK